jgi:hypothetical protein
VAKTVHVNLSPLWGLHRQIRDDLEGVGSGPVRTAIRQCGTIYMGAMRERFAANSRGGGDWPALKPSTVLSRKYKGRASKKALGPQARTAHLTDDQRKLFSRTQREAKKRLTAQLRASGVKDAAKRAAALARAQAYQAVRRAGGSALTRRQVARNLIAAGNVAILRNTGVLFGALTVGAAGNVREDIRNGIRVGIGGPASHSGGKLTIGQLAAMHNNGEGRLPRRPIIVQPSPDTARRMVQVMTEGMRRAAAATMRKGK